MVSYILKRILFMIPVLGIIIVLSFCLFQYSGADPTRSLLLLQGVIEDSESSYNFEKEYNSLSHELGRDQPLFYFSLIPSYYPDTLHKIVLPSKKSLSIRLLQEYKNWNKVSDYVSEIENLKNRKLQLNQNLKQAIFQFDRTINPIDLNRIQSSIIDDLADEEIEVRNAFQDLNIHQKELINSKQSFFYPKLLFHGSSNQFHNWFKNVVKGNFGISIIDSRPVRSKLYKSLKWTLSLSLLSVLIGSIISICIGFVTAYKRNEFIDKLIYFVLFVLFSIPLFWLATLMIVFFTSGDFGKWTNIFPSVGIFYTGSGSIIKEFSHNFSLLILPIFCLVVRSTAYLGRQVRASIINQSNEGYYLAALSKGMSQKTALWKHVLPNALLPFITIMTAAIPASLTGALVIEVLFNIPGTGRLMFNSILNDDWNMISAILIVISVATMVFYLIGDILYAYVNPRIKLES